MEWGKEHKTANPNYVNYNVKICQNPLAFSVQNSCLEISMNGSRPE